VSPDVSITWWGHVTTTVELAGRRFLTDPVLTGRVAHLSRIGSPVPEGSARQADAVLVSHLHLDHLDVASLRLLDSDVRIIAPTGTARALSTRAPGLGRRVEEVDAGAVIDIEGVLVQAVPAAHDGRRSPVSPHRGPALGFILSAPHHDDVPQVWFAGDTGLFPAMAELGPVGIAVVPVGGWGPTLGPTHLDPTQAAEAVRRVGALDAVPIHYGTFWPTGLRRLHRSSFRDHFADPGIRFAHELATANPLARAHVLAPGGTVTIPGRAA
jgi:L-ascorbate metabolism protein UlaG (beta-lactamase superfamily)